jgi:hypothetical protein
MLFGEFVRFQGLTGSLKEATEYFNTILMRVERVVVIICSSSTTKIFLPNIDIPF